MIAPETERRALQSIKVRRLKWRKMEGGRLEKPKNSIIFTTLTLLILSFWVPPISRAQPTKPVEMPYVQISEVAVDGSIGVDEYKGSFHDPKTGMDVYWEHDGVNMYVGLVSPGTGWVGIGFGPSGVGMDGSNIIIAYVEDDTGLLVMLDEVGVGYKHLDDASQGGTDDIIDKAGFQGEGETIVEFIFPLNSGDPNDHQFEPGGTYGVFLSHHASADDFTTYHREYSDLLDLQVERVEVPQATPTPAPSPTLPSSPTPTPTPTPPEPKTTTLILDIPKTVAQNEPFKLSAALRDEDGDAIQGAAVNFYISTTFGWLKIGSAATDPEGVATLNHTQKEAGTIQIKAVYEGDESFEASDSSASLEIMERGTVSSSPAGPIDVLSVWALPAVVAIIGLVVSSVFGAFGYVLYQLYRISREESRSSRIPWARTSKGERM